MLIQTMMALNKLEKILTDLGFKELEILQKLSKEKHDTKKYHIIRTISNHKTNKFVAVNGDWEQVMGYSEEYPVNMSWEDFIPKTEQKKLGETFSGLKEEDDYTNYGCNFINNLGEIIPLNWSVKFFHELGLLISIGVIPKKQLKPEKNKSNKKLIK